MYVCLPFTHMEPESLSQLIVGSCWALTLRVAIVVLTKTLFLHGWMEFWRTTTTHNSLNELVNLGFWACFYKIRRLHSVSWLSAASNFVANFALGQIMAQISILAYPRSWLTQNTVTAMPEIIFQLLRMKVNRNLKQKRQNTCNSLQFKADGLFRGDRWVERMLDVYISEPWGPISKRPY